MFAGRKVKVNPGTAKLGDENALLKESICSDVSFPRMLTFQKWKSGWSWNLESFCFMKTLIIFKSLSAFMVKRERAEIEF